MALPALNNKTALGNLSLDDKASIISSLVHSGKLQLANYGNINFNQNVAVSGGTATKEGGGTDSSITNTMIRVLEQIRDSITNLNTNIASFIESSKIEKEVAQNLIEAQQNIGDAKVPGEGGSSHNYDFNKPFKTIIQSLSNIEEILSKMLTNGGGLSDLASNIAGGFGSGAFGGIFSKLLSALGKGLGFLGRKIPILAAGYVLSQLPWESIAQKGKELISGEGDIAQGISDIFSSEFSETGENGTAQISEQGTSQLESGQYGSPNQETPQLGSGQYGPPNQETSTRERSTTQTSNQTATRSRFERIDGSIATDVDLNGIQFVDHSSKGMPLKLEKQILKALAQRLQHIKRSIGGKTLIVVSGYRTPEYNKKVGGAKNSQHIQRKAVDISKKGMSIKEQKMFIKASVEAGVGAIGFYPTFFHIDIRNRGTNGRIARWGKMPVWAIDIINNPDKYGDGVEEEIKTAGEDHKEEQENSGQVTVEQEQNSGTAAQTTTPQTTAKQTETATPESGTTEAPEEQEEEEEQTSEKVLTDPSLNRGAQQTTATRQTGEYPRHIENLFDSVEKANDLPKGLLKAIANAETGHLKNNWNNRIKAVSPAGAVGLMQFMPETAKEMGLSDRENPEQSIIAAGKYFAKIKSIIKSDDPLLLAAAYNSGPNRESLKQHKIPELRETKAYVSKVATFMNTSQGGTQLAENATAPDNRPSGEEQPEQETTGTDTSTATAPEENLRERITREFKEAAESINEVATNPNMISEFVGGVGGMFGFDPKTLRKIQTEPEQGPSALDQQIREDAQTFFNRQAEFDSARAQASRKTQTPNQPQQQPIVNVNTGGSQQADSGFNPATPNQINVRDPAIRDMQNRSTATTRTVG